MRWSRLLVFLALLIGAGCTGPPAAPQPRGVLAITLSAQKKMSEVALRLQHLLKLTLPPAPPHYHWDISFHDARFLKLMTDITPGMDGAGATVSFLAIAPGRTRLRFMLLPSTTARTVEPADQQEVIVGIR